MEDPSPVIEWLRATLGRGRVPDLFTFVSSALRLYQAAGERGGRPRLAFSSLSRASP
jgi:hypothetical protein